MAQELARRLRPITKEEAMESYKELVDLDCSDIGKFSRTGLKTLDYFFLHNRVKAKTKRHISFYEAMKDTDIVEELNQKMLQIKKKDPEDLTPGHRNQMRYDVFQLYYGTINQFRPSEVKRLICRLKPTVGVLDFSAGWGGRCLGTIASGLPYVGIDANLNLKPSYTKMLEAIGEDAKKAKLIFQPSETVDFSKYDYDLIFTSPPYFMLEEYEKMPQYGSEEGFLDKFFKPVVQNSWKHLKPGGHMALNMPKAMYDSVKGDLPPLWKRLQLPIKNRHAGNAGSGREIGSSDKGQVSEGIYVWKKSGTGKKTRKVKK
jgi:hypothetical protein